MAIPEFRLNYERLFNYMGIWADLPTSDSFLFHSGKGIRRNINHRDPACMDNLALHPEYHSIKTNLKNKLFEKLKAEGDPRMFGNGHVFDEYEYAGAGSRNFYERYMGGEDIKAGWVNESDFEKNFREKE